MCCKDLRSITNTEQNKAKTNKKSKKNKNKDKEKDKDNEKNQPTYCPSCNLAFCSSDCAFHPTHALECGLIPKVCGAVIETDKQNAKVDLSTMLLIIRVS
jgi:hypothetical protein